MLPKSIFKKGHRPWNKGKHGLKMGWPKGKKHSKETCKKMSIAKLGKPSWNKGKKWSEEHKKKLSKIHMGKSAPWKRVPVPKETRRKISLTLRKIIGEKSTSWKGGIYKTNGYIYIYKPNHPSQKKGRRYIPEHRLVMEKHLGRFLKPSEICHHKNGDGTDNRLENLELMTRADHQRHHKPRLGTGKIH